MIHFVTGTICITLFCLLLLATKKGKTRADWYLIAWHSVVVINLSAVFIVSSQYQVYFKGLLLMSSVVALLHGPLLLNYTRSILNVGATTFKSFILHLFPFFVFLILQLAQFVSFGFFQNYVVQLTTVVGILSACIYFIVIFNLLKTTEQDSKEIFSNLENRRVLWLKNISIMFLGLCAIFAASQLLYFTTSFQLPQYGNIYSNIFLCAMILVIEFYGLRQTTIYTSMESSLIQDSKKKTDIKYEKTAISNETLSHYRMSITNYMVREKPFLDPDITLHSLANKIGVSPHNLSQTLNREFNQNFFDFINKHRVGEFKEKLAAGEHKTKTLLGLAFESGFNSKASFNRAFKKFESVSPQQYLDAKH
jgi:AraC-like DNA-binding protein